MPDAGLGGPKMPGSANQPQPMVFDPTMNWFTADGIPVTPYDDAGSKNYYPMFHVVARDSAANILAATDIVTPVSDEMDCRACHASDSSSTARPAAGWVYHASAERDYRLNILRKHDENLTNNSVYNNSLLIVGYSPDGLYATVTKLSTPILCARCHSSNALPHTGITGVPPLTQAIHSMHAGVMDPTNGQTLDSNTNRSACYRCHPGSQTRCLRGAMGSSVAADGSLAIQCQSCHGSMSLVGGAGRSGWLDEPTCQNCHTGTAMLNSGQIRFTSALDGNGNRRIPADTTFATTANMPAMGLSLFRFSTGHGGLQCEACHNSTHAEYPTLHRNDSIQSLQVQGHVGLIADCVSCHYLQPSTTNGGPHGMHPVGQQWAGNHDSAVERGGAGQCKVCHGADYRGTVLSRSLGDRTVSTRFGVKQFWRGFQVGCYACHNGPGSESSNPNRAPLVVNASATTSSGTAVDISLNGTDSDNNPLVFRIVSQPGHGRVALNNQTATFIPDPAFAGADSFTFAAWDGSIQSNLGTVSVSVASEFFVPFYQADADSYLGIAVSNFGATAANVRVAGYGGQSLLQEASQLFNLSIGVGSLRVDSDGPGVIGDVLFGDPGTLKFAASSPLESRPFTQAVFSRVANGLSYFTGLAMLNPNARTASITLDVYDVSGSKTGSTVLTLGPKQRFSKLLTELLPVSAGQMGGYIILTSNLPVFAQELYGDSELNFLSAVPARIVQ
jgi:hypothetical protein